MDRNNIVPRRQTGKLMISHIKQEQIEREVVFYLGNVSRMFNNKELDEDLVENMDETHFVVNFDNGKTLGFVDSDEIKICRRCVWWSWNYNDSSHNWWKKRLYPNSFNDISKPGLKLYH